MKGFALCLGIMSLAFAGCESKKDTEKPAPASDQTLERGAPDDPAASPPPALAPVSGEGEPAVEGGDEGPGAGATEMGKSPKGRKGGPKKKGDDGYSLEEEEDEPAALPKTP